MTQQEAPEFLRIRNVPIYFKEDWATGIGGGLWSTGLAMAKYLNSDHAAKQLERLVELSHHRRTINILELGSGNGLLAACWLALGSRGNQNNQIQNLVVTDTNEHLPLIEQTLKANEHLLSCGSLLTTSSSARVTADQKGKDVVSPPRVFVLEHRWGDFQDLCSAAATAETTSGESDGCSAVFTAMAQRLATGKKCDFDLIVGSDLAYHEDLYDPLIESLWRFTERERNNNQHEEDPVVILLGCTMSDTTPGFFDRLLDKGFVYQRLADHLLESDYRGRIFGIFVIQRRPTCSMTRMENFPLHCTS